MNTKDISSKKNSTSGLLSGEDEIRTSKHLNIEQPTQEIKCRICLSDFPNLIRPCSCRGSIGFVHEACMKEWIEVKEEKTFQTYINPVRSTTCQICQVQIVYRANFDRKCSWSELRERVKRFPGFFAAHTILLIVLLVPTVLLTVLLLNTYTNVDPDNDIAPITIESVFLVLTSMSFLKMLIIWMQDYALSNRINVLKIYLPHELVHLEY